MFNSVFFLGWVVLSLNILKAERGSMRSIIFRFQISFDPLPFLIYPSPFKTRHIHYIKQFKILLFCVKSIGYVFMSILYYYNQVCFVLLVYIIYYLWFFQHLYKRELKNVYSGFLHSIKAKSVVFCYLYDSIVNLYVFCTKHLYIYSKHINCVCTVDLLSLFYCL